MPNLRSLNIRALLQQGLAHQSRLQLPDAVRAYEEVLRRSPNHFDALHMLGVVAIQNERYQAAAELIARALQQKPGEAAAHNNFALALMRLGRIEEAVRSYERVIAARPDSVDTHSHYASALAELGRLDEALESCNRAIELRPEAALGYLSRALVLRSMQRAEEALASCEKATQLQPEWAEAWDKRGAALRDLLRLDEALACFGKAIELRPEFALAHMNAGMVHLLRGGFDRGWSSYDRRNMPGGPVAGRAWRKPRWRGEETLAGKTLLVWSEQGLGDTIQFCRYASLLRAKGANVILSVQECLRALLGGLDAQIQICSEADAPPEFDFHCPLVSLPLAFGTTEGTIPRAVPYLKVDAERALRWQDRIGRGGFRIGICWQGSKLPIDVGRSFPLSALDTISRTPGIRLISLQKGYGCEQLDSMPAGMRVEVPGDGFDAGPNAFLDTAAAMASMDLVITSDTAVAHLAGALGRPTWVALKHVPDWRWLLEREDSPWYPGHRLFRQKQRGAWDDVFRRMQEALLGEPRARSDARVTR
jgi:tetratricopeptide (TPR) repeat protein